MIMFVDLVEAWQKRPKYYVGLGAKPDTETLLLKDIQDWAEEFGVLLETLKKEREETALGLLQLRAGGMWTCFEAGRLYQILLELGLKPFTKREQATELERNTCHFVTEKEAEAKLKELLGEKKQ